MNAKLVFVHALSGLHPGTGQGTGVIDLPVAREVATGIPYLPGSSLKGVLRDHCQDPDIRRKLFGPDSATITDANAFAGAAIFSDQRVLLFPVRSLAGTMAWVTSPFILQRFRRDCLNAGVTPEPPPLKMQVNMALVRVDSVLVVTANGQQEIVMLEDLDLAPRRVAVARQWADWLKVRLFPDDSTWQDHFASRFCIVHDDVLGFLLETATEVTARNVLKDTKTSDNLWYEESLPAETILQGLVVGQKVGASGLTPDEVLEKVAALTTAPLRLGGNTTTGRGLCRVIMEG
jgi:CRISPR-associated protein Cmr4